MASRMEDYEVLYTIGSGSYGRCQKIRRRFDGKVLVWKELDYGSMGDSEKQMLVSEVNLLRELKHPNIVRYYDRIIDRSNSKLYIIMEHCEGGDLAGLIRKCIIDGKYLEESFVLRVLAQLALALRECHRRRDGRTTVLHRDLKPANIFLDGQHNVKLGDFGLARILHHETSFAKTFVGTPYYMSPEQMNHVLYNEKSDIWSLGCLMYELCALSPPFTASNQSELAEKIRVGRFKRIPYRYCEELNTLICRMLHLKDYLRPSVDSILQSSLLSEAVSKEQRGAQEKSRKRCAEKLTPSTGANQPLKSETELKLKEQALKERERALERREEQLEQREKELCLREELCSERMTQAENLLKAFNGLHQQRAMSPRSRTDIDVAEKKNILFPSESKENIRLAAVPEDLPQRKLQVLSNLHQRRLPVLSDVKPVCPTRSRSILGLR